MPELLRSFLKFATLGITCEIVFTAFLVNYQNIKKGQKFDWSLKGYSFIWMIPIYGLISFLGPLVIDPLQATNYFLRIAVYVSILYVIEYITGWTLRATTGKCPWEYDFGWHVHGLINFSMAPAWAVFVALAEYLYLYY